MMKVRTLVAAVLLTVGPRGLVAQADVPQYAGPFQAVECTPRSGVGHVMDKIRSGSPVRIAYFGGSITEMDGWRRLSREWLQARYPGCVFSEIPAAIGGTGSSLGVFRFGQDVLDKKPDLIFVEFATNDHEDQTEQIWRNFEGFIRQAWKDNPDIDFIFAYTITDVMKSDYCSGYCTRAASAMEQLAAHYGITSINFGPRVAAEINTGRLVMSIGEVATAVPVETPNRDELIEEELAQQGKILFSKDGVHPVLRGHRFYLESITNSWPQIENLPAVDNEAKLGNPFADTTMEKAKMVSPEPWMMSGTWQQVAAQDKNGGFNTRFGGQSWMTETAGSRLSFRFKGSRCMIYDLLGPDCGQVWVTVDGVRRANPVARFDRFCTYYRLATLDMFSGADGVHEVVLELDAGQPDRTPVKEQGVTDEELAGEMYNGIEWTVGRIMLVGDIVGSESPAKAVSWFDANVESYTRWPRDAELAEKGEWSAPGGELGDRASMAAPGVLEVEAGEQSLVFSADEPLVLEQGKKVVVSSDFEISPYNVAELPEVDPLWKAAVVVGTDDVGTRYYGLCRSGSSNVWVPLEGVTVPDKTFVRLDLAFTMQGSGVVVTYKLDGVEARVNGRTAVPVVASKRFSGVHCGGFGQLTSLVGESKSTISGREFAYYAEFTPSAAALGGAVLENFPVLVRVSPSAIGNFSYSQCAADGSDIRFITPDAVVLDAECETWNPAGESLFWVSVPKLSATEGAFTMYWGEGRRPAPSPGVPAKVWSTGGYVSVLHMDVEEGYATTDSAGAFTSAAFVNPLPSMVGARGVVGGAYVNANRDQVRAIQMPSEDSKAMDTRINANGGVVTISAWVHNESGGGENYGMLLNTCGTPDGGGVDGIETGVEGSSSTWTVTDNSPNRRTGVPCTDLSVGWHLITISYAAAGAKVYIDGVEVPGLAGSRPYVGGVYWEWMIGARRADGGAACSWVGGIDEFRVRLAETSAERARTEYLNVVEGSIYTAGRAKRTASGSIITLF